MFESKEIAHVLEPMPVRKVKAVYQVKTNIISSNFIKNLI